MTAGRRRRIRADHDCEWRDEAERLRGQVDELKTAVEQIRAEMESMKRRLLGPKTEKIKPIGHEVREKVGIGPAAAQEARLANAKLRSARVVTERVEHKVPDGERKCPKCGRDKLKRVGPGKPSVEWEYVPGYFRRRVHVRETLACPCGQHIIAAQGPGRVGDRVQYGPGFIAFIVVAKCGDSIPVYRLEKSFRRLGVPVARSTMTDLFHRAAELLVPLVAPRCWPSCARRPSCAPTRPRSRCWAPRSAPSCGHSSATSLRPSSRTALQPQPQRRRARRGTPAARPARSVVDMYTGYNQILDGRPYPRRVPRPRAPASLRGHGHRAWKCATPSI